MGFRTKIFLKDVATLALTAFGGPNAHISHFINLLVVRRRYLTEEELLELNALCNILPGPSSTQTITAVGFKMGGAGLAYLTLLVWLSPALFFMIGAGILFSYLGARDIDPRFATFLGPIAVGFVVYSAYKVITKVIHTKTGAFLLLLAAIVSYYIRTPYVLPFLIILGGAFSARKFKRYERIEKEKIVIPWANFILWAGVALGAALLGNLFQLRGIILFENFYRNGSLIFGGGQVLIPALFTEFVQFKGYLTSTEFLSGYAVAQMIPGPVFAFSGFVGAMSMREYGLIGEIFGGLTAGIAIFLPGTFLIFFVIRFWEQLKRYRVVKASLEGIMATTAGIVVSAAIFLFEPIPVNIYNISFIFMTFAALLSGKIPAPFIIIGGILLGFLL